MANLLFNFIQGLKKFMVLNYLTALFEMFKSNLTLKACGF